MDGEEQRGQLPPGLDPAHLDNAVRAMQTKKPIPTIDFTLHTMEDGSQVNTMERVCKGTITPIVPRHLPLMFEHSSNGDLH